MDFLDRIEQLQRDLVTLKEDVVAAAAEQESKASAHSGLDLNSDPAVREAAIALAKAIARAQGFDLPMQVADGDFGQLPVMTLPEQFQQYGGIGIGVMVAPPTEAARGASARPAYGLN